VSESPSSLPTVSGQSAGNGSSGGDARSSRRGVATLVVLLAALAAYRFWPRSAGPSGPGKSTQISHWNKAISGAKLSPDGHTLAFSSISSGVFQVFVMLASGGEPLQLTSDEGDKRVAAFSADGTEIYDYIFCSAGGAGTDGTYDERTVDPSTGALGIPQQIFYWSEGQIGNPQTVQIVGHLIFDFVILVAQPPYEYNQLLVFPLTTKKNAKPLINCTATMLAGCGSDIGVAHPSAKYVFYTNAQDNTTEVDAVNLSSKQIVATGTTFSTPTPNVLEFSPDGSVVYSWDSTTSTISIFGFNASNAAITTGGSISDSSAIVILPTERR